ncbi:DUF2569 family protein [Polaribacter atrinae]|uniref:DUF2569 family protein n=1 Tax=Polaribacter atrinae TaxID=1333662 RepID=UPI0030F61908
MLKNLFTVVFSFLFISLNFAQIKKITTPNWVEMQTYASEPKIDFNEVTQGTLILLYDQQTEVDKEENYFKVVTKITENVGIQEASSINVSFDPSYQKLSFHEINIVRNGKIISKLNTSEFQTIRQELDAENYIYDGSLSAITHISDVRVGDIIEYSFTRKGYNPIHKDYFAEYYNLNNSHPIGKINVKITSKNKLEVKSIKNKLKFDEAFDNNKYTYSLLEENINATHFEDNTPLWYLDANFIEIGNYKSWENLIDWGTELFKVSDNLSSSLLKKINKIDKENTSKGQKIEAALQFVQDEVRYLGLENGISAYKPSSPNKVFKQRFGDCKDKSLLLVTILNRMNIEAYPVLVSTYLKKTVTNLLPNPAHFNHCVVKVIDENKGEYWYDPTITNQGGTFNKVVFPDYRFGLVLKKGNKDLEEIFPFADNTIDITDHYILSEVGKGAILRITSVYSEAEADNIRFYFKNNSIINIQKEFEKFYSDYHANIKSLGKPEYTDNLKTNTFTINETYKIDSIWEPSYLENHIGIDFSPYTITNVLSMPSKIERKTPFELSYPITRSHTINVELPEAWNVNEDNFNISTPNIFYDFDVLYNKSENLLTLKHLLKIQKDFVSVAEFPGFYNDLKKLDNELNYNISYNKGGNTTSTGSVLKYLGIFMFICFLLFFTWLAFKLYQYNITPKIESYYEENKPIGGWLILIGIGLCISPIRVFMDLLSTEIYLSGDWLVYFSSEDFSISIGLLLIVETLFNAAVLVFLPLIIVLFLKKRSSFPKVYATFLIVYLVFILSDSFLASALTETDGLTGLEEKQLLKTFISTGIIVPYLLLSERVKETFLKSYQ